MKVIRCAVLPNLPQVVLAGDGLVQLLTIADVIRTVAVNGTHGFSLGRRPGDLGVTWAAKRNGN